MVPPSIVKPLDWTVGLIPLMVLFVRVSVPLNVAIVPLVGSVTVSYTHLTLPTICSV